MRKLNPRAVQINLLLYANSKPNPITAIKAIKIFKKIGVNEMLGTVYKN